MTETDQAAEKPEKPVGRVRIVIEVGGIESDLAHEVFVLPDGDVTPDDLADLLLAAWATAQARAEKVVMNLGFAGVAGQVLLRGLEAAVSQEKNPRERLDRDPLG